MTHVASQNFFFWGGRGGGGSENLGSTAQRDGVSQSHFVNVEAKIPPITSFAFSLQICILNSPNSWWTGIHPRPYWGTCDAPRPLSLLEEGAE